MTELHLSSFFTHVKEASDAILDNRQRRLARLRELNAPEFIIENELRLLFEAEKVVGFFELLNTEVEGMFDDLRGGGEL